MIGYQTCRKKVQADTTVVGWSHGKTEEVHATRRPMNMDIPGKRERGRPQGKLSDNTRRWKQDIRMPKIETNGEHWRCQQLAYIKQETHLKQKKDDDNNNYRHSY